ncbi:MAG: NmrA family NAD(P)-binding protein [Candidatus Kapaibacterium sp.]|jgi:uncharacterized protein YbjT (DUF2867 family)
MNYVITGSLGNISKPIVEGLLSAGHTVSVLTRSEETAAQIKALGATPFVGDMEQSDFVQSAFANADVVYTMIPPNYSTDDFRAYQNRVGKNMADAIRAHSIKKVVNLSSVGAHLGNGAGVVDGLSDFEKMLNAIENIDVKHLRPSFFYQNFYAQIGMITSMGIMGSNYAGDIPMALVHVKDIAAAALEELLSLDFTGYSVRYIVSDVRTSNDVAHLLSEAIGKNIPWVEFPDDQQKAAMLQMGMKETLVDGYQELGRGFRDGLLMSDYNASGTPLAATKLEEFIAEFAPAVQASLSA